MQFCERCIGLKHGKVVSDGPTSALDLGLLQELYGAEFCDVKEGLDIYSRTAGHRPRGIEQKKSLGQKVCMPRWASVKA